jgi:cell volume regulation protein A
MFVVLGLLSTPSELLTIASSGLLISSVLIFLARPLATVPLLMPFRFSWEEHVLIAWVGLKGAVPIILATFPMMFELENGRLLFNVVFFVVLVSATLQGWTLPVMASRLHLQDDRMPGPAVSLELMALRDINADIVDYAVYPGSALAGRTVQQLRLPEGAVLAMISRDTQLIAPRGNTTLQVGDHLFIVARADTKEQLDHALAVVADP